MHVELVMQPLDVAMDRVRRDAKRSRNGGLLFVVEERFDNLDFPCRESKA